MNRTVDKRGMSRRLRRAFEDIEEGLRTKKQLESGSAVASATTVSKPFDALGRVKSVFSNQAGTITRLEPPDADTLLAMRFLGSPVLESDAGNLKLAGSFQPANINDVLTLLSDGRDLYEVARAYGPLGGAFIPAERYGCVPDTGADMTTRIQRAFDECPAGATLVFRSGTYVVSGDLTLSRQIHVWAYGAIFSGGTSVFTNALLTLGDTTGVPAAQTQRIRIMGLKVTRTATVNVTATLLHDGIRIYNVVGGEFVDLEAENFRQGFHLVAATLGCYNNITTNYFARHCRYGVVLEPINASGFVNENTFIGGRHLIAGWSAGVREADFEHVRILWAPGFTFNPNNNRFIACNFEGSAFRKLRCEGALNYFEHCRWESVKAAGFEITIGEVSRASSAFGSNMLLHGNTLDFLAENALTRIESLNTTGIINGMIIITNTRTYWWAGTASAPALTLGNNTSNANLSLDVVRTGTNSRSLGIRAGGSGLAGTPLGTIDWYDTSSAFHNALSLDNTNFPTNRPLRIERGLLVNFGQSNNDSRVSGQTLANLTFWDASANRVGFGTDTPDRLVEILDASAPQLRLTHTDGSRYTDFQHTITGTWGGLCIIPTANADTFKAVHIFGTTPSDALTFFDDGADLFLRTQIAKNFTIDVAAGQHCRLQQNFSTYIGIDMSGEASCNTPFSASTTLASDTVGKAFGVVATRSGGLPAAGFGSMMEFTLEADDGADPGTFVVAAQWQAVWDNPSSAVPDSSTRFILRDAGTLKEIMRVAGALPGVRIENAVGGAPNALLDVRGTAIFNEDAANADWRAETQSNTHGIFLDASANALGLFYSTPATNTVHIGGPSSGIDFRFDGGTVNGLIFGDASADQVIWGALSTSFTDLFVLESTFRANSGMAVKRSSSASSPINIASTDFYYRVDSSGGAITVNLPATDATGIKSGKLFVIKREGGNNVTITPNGTNTVEGGATLVLDNTLECVWLISNGGAGAAGNWEAVAMKGTV